MGKKCRGCGIELQTQDDKKAGYVPENVYLDKDEIVCKRCFKLKNYGEYIPLDINHEEYKREVKKIMNEIDVVLFVVDIIDFEGSFDERIVDIIGKKPVILCINKVDLIPDRKHPSEVSQWVKNRIGTTKLKLLDLAIVSMKNGYGVKGIMKKLTNYLKDGGKVGVIGVTNVGKSSLINKLFEKDGFLTVSKYPGTTLKAVRSKIPNSDLEIVDTPGIIPIGRISDMVCGECNQRMVPAKEISRKTFKMQPNKILMLGGVIKIKILSEDSYTPIFVVFASEGVKFHSTNEERALEVKEQYTGDWIVPPCNNCADEYYKLPMKSQVFEIEQNKDLVFKGLGWISVRRGPLKIEVTMPEGAETVIRDAFIMPHDRGEKEEE